MKTRVLSVDAQYSIEGLFREEPPIRALFALLDLDFQDERKAENKTQFITQMQESAANCNVLIIVDGSKDLYTREVLAQGFQKPLYQHTKAAENIANCFSRANRQPSALALAYANIPEGAIPLLNENTVEQGFLMVFPSLCIAVLPSSPHALETLFVERLFPLLLKSIYPGAYTLTLPLTQGRVDEVEAYAARIRRRAKGFLPLVYVGENGPSLKLTAIRASQKEAQQCCDSFLEDLVSELGSDVSPVARIGVKGSRALAPKHLEEDEPLPIPTRKPTKAARRSSPKSTKKSTPPPKQHKGSAIRTVLLSLFVCVFLGSAGYLAWYQLESMKNRNSYESLRDVYDHPGVLPPAGYPAAYDHEFAALWSINPDTVGWIRIPGTALDYPVMQTTDNEKYYRTNFEGNYSEHAVPFVDAAVDLKAPSANTLIYGHNIRTDGQMFNILKGYKELAFLQQHPLIEFNSVFHRGKYKIFSIFYSNTRPEHGQPFPYHEFINATDLGGEQKYIDDVLLRSIFKTGVDVNASDELLTLSTCSYEFKDARYVVVARKLRPGEAETCDPAQITPNPDPLYPDIWYKLFGGAAPAGSTASAQTEHPFAFLQQEPIRPEDAPSLENNATMLRTTPLALTKPAFPASFLAEEALPAAQEMAAKQRIIKKSSKQSASPTVKKKVIKGKAGTAKTQPSQEEPPSSQSTGQGLDDITIPISVKINGKLCSGTALEIISGMVEAEMGASFQPEALKAQAVAGYTYVRYHNAIGISPGVASKKPVSAAVREAVEDVLGETVRYQGSYANTTYCASNAGNTNDSEHVWGGELPYLISVESPGDKTLKAYGATKTFTEDEVAARIRSYCKLDPYSYGDPADWFTDPRLINGLYVESICVCGQSISGRELREDLFQFQLNSAAFELMFDGDCFRFTTYGYGHCVGMSQQGADWYAKEGWDYQRILAHYYPGTDLWC